MSEPGNPVLFQRAPRLIDRRGLRVFAERLQHEVAAGRSFCCLIADDRELQRLNRQFLKKDCPTDVLSFPADGAGGFLGELAISGDRAREQAQQHGHTIDEELRILMLHGVLHLLGMDHETDRGKMARAESKWRKLFDLPTGLIERVKQ